MKSKIRNAFRNGITAHRGDSTHHPENTLPAFAAAVKLGVDWIELDVRVTADGRLAVLHDHDSGRVAEENLLVEESTFEALQALDAAAKFRRRHGLSVSQCPPARIPELSEVFELLRGQNQTRVSVQPKASTRRTNNRCDIVRRVIRLAADLGVTGLLGFNDGGLEAMKLVKELDASLPVFWDMGSEHTSRDIDTAVAAGFESIVMETSLITAENITRCRQAGVIPGAWTVNDPQRFVYLQQMGIERFYTDDPALFLRLKRTEGKEPP